MGVGLALAQTYSSGLILEQAGQIEQAFGEYRLAAEKNPRELSAYAGLVRLSAQLGRYDTLVAVSRRLVKQHPDQADFTFGLIDGLLGAKQGGAARAEARQAAGRWPVRLAALADVFARHKEFGQAIEYCLQARKRGGDELFLADRLISLYDQAGQPVQAAREVVLVLGARPELLGQYHQKLSAFAARGGAGLVTELERIKDRAVRVRAQAAVYLALGKEVEAVRALKPVLSDQELYQFAHECEGQGALRAALAVYQEQKAHADAARVLRRLGRTSEALSELAQDKGTGAQFELAELHREQGRLQPATDAYEKVLARQPNHEPAAHGLAVALLGMGQTGPARARAMKQSRLTDRLLFLIARTHFYEAGFDSAGRYVAELLKQYPQSLLVNDALELAVLTGSGDRARELARLMLEYETGADGTGRAQKLTAGDDPVAEQASFLLARFLRRARKPKEALAALDDYLQRFERSSLAPKARLEQAYVFRDDLKDDSRYRSTLEQLMVEHPGSPYVPIARNLLLESSRPVPAEGIH